VAQNKVVEQKRILPNREIEKTVAEVGETLQKYKNNGMRRKLQQ